MLATPRFHQALLQSNLPATPSLTAWGTTLTAHATPHSKGAWSTIIASTTHDVYGFWVYVNGTRNPTTDTSMMFDIAIGAAQENIIVPEFLCGFRALPDGACGPQCQYFPIFIPRGAKISARIQALITNDTADFLLFAQGGASALAGPFFSGCDAYGTTIASTTGTSHTPGNTGAESTAANVGGTLSKNYGAVALGLQGIGTVMGALAEHWELMVGGVTVCEWYALSQVGETMFGPIPQAPFLASLPSGTQLQVRAEASGTGEATGVALYCFY